MDPKNMNLCHDCVDFFAPGETDIIPALMFGMEHPGRDELIKLFHRLIVVVVAYCLCLLHNAMIFKICGEFFDVFAD